MSDALAPAAAPDRPPVRRGAKGKAIFAIVAGTALLLGGAGTLAYWSDEAGLAAGPISSGDLNLVVNPENAWTLEGVVGEPIDIEPAALTAVQIVPGDVLTLTQDIEVILEGDTILGDLSVSVPDDFGGELADYLEIDLTVTGEAPSPSENTFRFNEDTVPEVTATLVIRFEPDTTTAPVNGEKRYGANSSVNLNDITFTLTQVFA